MTISQPYCTVLNYLEGSILVEAFVKVDGTEYRMHGYSLPANKAKVAERLVRAIEAGVVFSGLSLQDLSPTAMRKGKYVSITTVKVFGKSMEANLKELGF